MLKTIKYCVLFQQDLHHEDQTRLPVPQIWLLQWLLRIPASSPRNHSQVSEVSLPENKPSCAGFIRLQIIFVLDLLLREIIRIIRPFKEKLPLRLSLIWGDMNVIYCFPFEQYVGKSIIYSENDTSIIFIIIVIIINASPKS